MEECYMKKLLLVTALTAFTILNATSAFAQEVSTDSQSEDNVITSDVPVSVSFPDKETLEEVHSQNIEDLMKDVVGTPEDNKREKRDFSWAGLGECVVGTLGGTVAGGTTGVIAGASAGRAGGPQATAAGATIGGFGGAIGGGLTGAANSCF